MTPTLARPAQEVRTTFCWLLLAMAPIACIRGEETRVEVAFDYPADGTILTLSHGAGLGGPRHGGPFFSLAGNGDLHYRNERDAGGRVVAQLQPSKVRQIMRFAVDSGLAEAKPIGPTHGITDVGTTPISVTLSSYQSPTRIERSKFTVNHSVVAPEWRLAYEPNNRRAAAIGALARALTEMKESGGYVAPSYSDLFLERHEATYWDDQPGPWRSMHDGLFVSLAMPQLKMRIADRFNYLGEDRFELRETATVERHHWLARKGNDVNALLILQFEGFLPGVNGRYRYGIPDGTDAAGSNFRFSPQPISLAGAEFIHNTWAYDWSQQVADNPDAEVAHTHTLLRDRGVELAGPVVMSRFVRVVDPTGRHELIISYIEPLHSLDLYPDGQPPSAAFDALSTRITDASLEAFGIIEIQ